MRADKVTALLWLVAAACAVVACVLSLVIGEWLAAVGCAIGFAGALGAAGQSARLLQLHRDLGVIGFGVHRAEPYDNYPEEYDEYDYESPDYGPDYPRASDMP